MIKQFPKHPKNLFLLDGVGALLSAFLLGVVLVRFESVFGIPPKSLYILAAIPCFFAFYDLICYLYLKSNHGTYLRILAIFNLGYCLLSLSLAFQHRNQLLPLGWSYLVLEIVLICYLVKMEWQTK